MELYNKKIELEKSSYSEKLIDIIEEFEREEMNKKDDELRKYEEEKNREELRKLAQKNIRVKEQLLADQKRELENLSYNLSKKYEEQKKSVSLNK